MAKCIILVVMDSRDAFNQIITLIDNLSPEDLEECGTYILAISKAYKGKGEKTKILYMHVLKNPRSGRRGAVHYFDKIVSNFGSDNWIHIPGKEIVIKEV